MQERGTRAEALLQFSVAQDLVVRNLFHGATGPLLGSGSGRGWEALPAEPRIGALHAGIAFAAGREPLLVDAGLLCPTNLLGGPWWGLALELLGPWWGLTSLISVV